MRFRKKAIVIEAKQLTSENWLELSSWCRAHVARQAVSHPMRYLVIRTKEGDMRADIGDWIIKGVKGEFYPCKPDVFELTYEKYEGIGHYEIPDR